MQDEKLSQKKAADILTVKTITVRRAFVSQRGPEGSYSKIGLLRQEQKEFQKQKAEYEKTHRYTIKNYRDAAAFVGVFPCVIKKAVEGKELIRKQNGAFDEDELRKWRESKISENEKEGGMSLLSSEDLAHIIECETKNGGETLSIDARIALRELASRIKTK